MLLYLGIYLGQGMVGTIQNNKVDFFHDSEKTHQALKKQINYISKKLHEKDYGIYGGHWGLLSAHTFYLYALGNIYLANPSDKEFQKFAQKEARFVYEYVNGEGKKKFVQPTKIPYGIIYQWHKLHTLATMVMLWMEEKRSELYQTSDLIAWYLSKYPKNNGESYQDLARYIDNIDAYYGLYLTDLIRQKHSDAQKNQALIASWLENVKKDVNAHGLMLSEAYSRRPERNQSRGIWEVWMLSYLYDMDHEFFVSQYPKFQSYFVDESFGMYFVRDVPRDETPHFHLSSWPCVMGYSSSAQILALGVYHTAGNQEAFQKTLKALDFSLSYNPYLGHALPAWGPTGESVLINSLILWGKTARSWRDWYEKIP